MEIWSDGLEFQDLWRSLMYVYIEFLFQHFKVIRVWILFYSDVGHLIIILIYSIACGFYSLGI